MDYEVDLFYKATARLTFLATYQDPPYSPSLYCGRSTPVSDEQSNTCSWFISFPLHYPCLVRVHRGANPARDRRGRPDDARHDAARRERLQDVGAHVHRHVRGVLRPRAGIRVSEFDIEEVARADLIEFFPVSG